MGANNLYDWEMSQKLIVEGFEWLKDILVINEKLKNYKSHKRTMMKKVMKDIFLK